MKLRVWMAMTAGVMLVHSAAWADSSSLALEKVTCRVEKSASASSSSQSSDLSFAVAPSSTPTTAVIHESVRWRPRRWREPESESSYSSSHKSGPQGFTQIHAGFLDPDGEAGSMFLAGFRAGGNVDRHVQLGVGADWAHVSERSTVIVSREPLPGGGTTERRQELAKSSSHLFPITAQLQITPGEPDQLHPYFGVAGGYNVLFVSAEDFTTGNKFDATYGGWGWQAYAGLAIPLSHNSSFNVEGFRNTARVGRDVSDPVTAQTYREEVDLHGFGVRAGLGWGF